MSTVALVATFVLLLSSVALADNVVNNVASDSSDPIAVGASTTVTYWVVATNASVDGQTGCNAADGTPALVSIITPAAVTASPGSLTFAACGSQSAQSVTFSASAPGDYPIAVSVSDPGAGGYHLTPAAFTLHVTGAVVVDTTPPAISYTLTGPVGANGWYVGDVIVDWSVSDLESTPTLAGCVDATIDFDTAGYAVTCSATSAGGASHESLTIKRDATIPTISATLDRAPDASGWFNIATGAPTVYFDAFDSTSGLASTIPAPHSFGEGAGQAFSQTVVDNAGNSASAGVDGISVDLTAPTITWNGGPSLDGSYYFGSVPAAPTCTAADELSGPSSCAVTGYSNMVGSHTMMATAIDLAGNAGSEARPFTVRSWTLQGFYRPVDMNGVFNLVKGGSTVPLKFEVFAGSAELSDVSIVRSFRYGQIACNAGAAVDDIEITATGGTTLRYDATAGQFIQNWQTPKAPVGTCYSVVLTTQDGSTLKAYFKIK